MRKMLVVFAAALLVAGAAYAFQEYDFVCDGTGNMVMDSPPVYSGLIVSGDLAPGTWQITVDDFDWPPVSDPAARWAYIWSNYYSYNGSQYLWRADFYGGLLDLDHIGVGTMTGYADITFQIPDYNHNGILEYDECYNGFSGVVWVVQEGTGLYSTLCGQGHYEGDYVRECDPGAPDYMTDTLHLIMHLDLEECGMGTDAATWGAVKALFE